LTHATFSLQKLNGRDFMAASGRSGSQVHSREVSPQIVDVEGKMREQTRMIMQHMHTRLFVVVFSLVFAIFNNCKNAEKNGQEYTFLRFLGKAGLIAGTICGVEFLIGKYDPNKNSRVVENFLISLSLVSVTFFVMQISWTNLLYSLGFVMSTVVMFHFIE
jgi:hypothetical protein